uniref:Putative secreted peptide n=1 Tax=Anopheles braziliensis TaxID=58242 RepID=A0A2M3ZP32_9DIPT
MSRGFLILYPCAAVLLIYAIAYCYCPHCDRITATELAFFFSWTILSVTVLKVSRISFSCINHNHLH